MLCSSSHFSQSMKRGGSNVAMACGNELHFSLGRTKDEGLNIGDVHGPNAPRSAKSNPAQSAPTASLSNKGIRWERSRAMYCTAKAALRRFTPAVCCTKSEISFQVLPASLTSHQVARILRARAGQRLCYINRLVFASQAEDKMARVRRGLTRALSAALCLANRASVDPRKRSPAPLSVSLDACSYWDGKSQVR